MKVYLINTAGQTHGTVWAYACWFGIELLKQSSNAWDVCTNYVTSALVHACFSAQDLHKDFAFQATARTCSWVIGHGGVHALIQQGARIGNK